MRRRYELHRASLAGLAVALFLLTACGEGETLPERPVLPNQPATLAELTGPWQATPLRLDFATRDRVARACRREIELPPGSTAVLIDARGASIVTVRMAGQDSGACHTLVLTAREVEGAGSGWSGVPNPPERLPVVDPFEITVVEKHLVGGGDLKVQGWGMYGRAGAGITSVTVQTRDHPVMTTTLENGWFGAWWPARAAAPPRNDLEAVPHPPFIVRGFDASGVLRAETGQ